MCLLPRSIGDPRPSNLLGRDREEVRVTGVLDREDTDAEEATGRGSERDVRALVEVDRGLGEHGVVLELRTAEGRGVARDQDELSCGGTNRSFQFPDERRKDLGRNNARGALDSHLPERMALRVDL